MPRPARPAVEVGEERVVGFVEDDRRVEAGAEPVGEQRLADADGPFDRDVPEIQGRAQYTRTARDRLRGRLR